MSEIFEQELDKMLCPGCRDGLYLEGEVTPFHIYADGSNFESCLATPERKQQLRQYFAKELLTDLQKAGV